MTANRWAISLVAVAAVLVAGGTAWAVRGLNGPSGGGVDVGKPDPAVPGEVDAASAGDIRGVSVSLDVPTYDMGVEGHGDTLTVTVANESGRELPGIALDVIVDDPGGGLPPMTVAGQPTSCHDEEELDEPGHAKPEKYVDESCLRRQRDGQEGCPLAVRGEGDVPLSRHARCVHSLDQGENRFEFDVRMLVDNITQIRDYPQLTVAARLSVDDETFADDSATLKTEYPREWDRLSFSGFPTELGTDRTEDNPRAWSFTITNDTGQDVNDADAVLNTGFTIGVGSDHPGCRRDKEKPKRYFLVCAGLDVPAGGSLTVEMTVYFGGDTDKLADESGCEDNGDDCGPSGVKLSIGEPDEKTFASGEAATTLRLVK